VASAQAASTRRSKAPSVREAQPSSQSRPTIGTQPVMMSSASAPALAEPPRTRLPGKVIANTSRARIRQAPSKLPPNQAAATASITMVTAGSMAARSSVPGPGGVEMNRVRGSRARISSRRAFASAAFATMVARDLESGVASKTTEG
jgi:hypothetical protein